jgi:hypothetical protein
VRPLFLLTTLITVGCHTLTGLDEFDIAGGGTAQTGGMGGAPTQGGGPASGGAGGEGGQVAACLTDLRDDFSGELTPQWNPWGGNVSATNDTLEVRWSGGSRSHSGVSSTEAQGDTQAFLYAQHTIDNRVGFYVLNGQLRFAIDDSNGADSREDIPFDHEEHRWWRLRREEDSLVWETAPDGSDWTLRRQAALPSFDLTAMPINIGGGATTSAPPAGSIAFDNFNLPP